MQRPHFVSAAKFTYVSDRLPSQSKVSSNLTLFVGFEHFTNRNIALCYCIFLAQVFTGFYQSGVGLSGFDRKERTESVKQVMDFWKVSQSPMILILPVIACERHFRYYAQIQSPMDAMNYLRLRISYTHFDPRAFWDINAAFAIEESGKPSRELFIGPAVEKRHGVSCIGIVHTKYYNIQQRRYA